MTKRTHISIESDPAMEKVRTIIMRKDRKEIEQLRHILDTREELSPRVIPIIEQELEFFKEKFPEEFEHVIHKLIDQRIKESQDAILDVMYPMVGKMVQKYVNQQFQLLRDRLDNQVEKSGVLSRLFNRAKGIKESDVRLSKLQNVSIEEIYVIQKNSGLLLGSASRNETVDPDSVAGMLTAIKLFVEDAFRQGAQNLEVIQYETYEIFLQTFHTYSMAVVMNGALSSSQKAALREDLFKLAEDIGLLVQKMDTDTNGRIREKLELFFMTSLKKEEKFLSKRELHLLSKQQLNK